MTVNVHGTHKEQVKTALTNYFGRYFKASDEQQEDEDERITELASYLNELVLGYGQHTQLYD